ncbi:MAG TPA: hypothetical protein V6D10_10060 [Trichocoleus sp.]|jgi:hypothetical protein
MNLFTQNQLKAEPAKVQQLKTWIYELLQLDQETSISISQLQCKETGCPPIETGITILTKPVQQFKIHKAIAEIEQSDLVQAFKSNHQ